MLIHCPHCKRETDPELAGCVHCNKPLPRHVLCAVCHKSLPESEAKNWQERYGGAVLHAKCFDVLFESVKCSNCNHPYFQPEQEHAPDKVNHACPKCKEPLQLSHCGGCTQTLVEEAQGVMKAPPPTRGMKYSVGSMFHTVCYSRQEAEFKKIEEEKRKRIMGERKSLGQCVMCGQALGMLEKLSRKEQHKGCHVYSK